MGRLKWALIQRVVINNSFVYHLIVSENGSFKFCDNENINSHIIVNYETKFNGNTENKDSKFIPLFGINSIESITTNEMYVPENKIKNYLRRSIYLYENSNLVKSIVAALKN